MKYFISGAEGYPTLTFHYEGWGDHPDIARCIYTLSTSSWEGPRSPPDGPCDRSRCPKWKIRTPRTTRHPPSLEVWGEGPPPMIYFINLASLEGSRGGTTPPSVSFLGPLRSPTFPPTTQPQTPPQDG